MTPKIAATSDRDSGGIAVTVEVRWFFEGPCPAAVEQWFGQGRTPEPEEREDRYLVLPGVTAVGIKLRGGVGQDQVRLEVKAQHGQPERFRPVPGVLGLAAAWSKWTLVLEGDAISSGLEPPMPVRTTRKRRQVRRLAHDADVVREVPASASAESGCDLELAVVTLDGLPDEPWWSLAFEAFGSESRAWAALRTTVPHVFRTQGTPPVGSDEAFAAPSSMAYPAWIAARV